MSGAPSPSRPEPTPREFKTKIDGRGGLVRVVLVGEPHDGRALYIDELELPAEMYATGNAARFEWWPPRLHEAMKRTALGNNLEEPPVRYVLHIPDETREPLLIREAG